ncbi:ATP-binding protein [Sulfitobacter sp. 1A13368]|uniref:ATP-binding protein n=1 Tax=Sulfitobacter sp. 1A13368 TaxID=3368593 RepID=UPI0037458917
MHFHVGKSAHSACDSKSISKVTQTRFSRAATLVTTNLPFDEWTGAFGTECLTGALLDQLTHQVDILGMNGKSYHLVQSQTRKATTWPTIHEFALTGRRG